MRGALHHWWPRKLSEFWADENGAVTWIAPDGTEKSSKPESWGAIRNGHTVNFGPEWMASFEGAFSRADTNFPYVVRHLLGVDSDFHQKMRSISKRLYPVKIDDKTLDHLRECLASLVVRSPRNRNMVIATVEHYRGSIQDKRERDNLIAMNLFHQFEAATKALRDGKFIVVFSEDYEFIFGDGFYHNISPGYPTGTNPKLVVPLTPNLTIIYFRPTQYLTQPNAFSVRAERAEVEEFNKLIQVYSKDMLFFRSQWPQLLSAFTKATHLQFEYHRVPWLQEIFDEERWSR
jgi:hypothetical protein